MVIDLQMFCILFKVSPVANVLTIKGYRAHLLQRKKNFFFYIPLKSEDYLRLAWIEMLLKARKCGVGEEYRNIQQVSHHYLEIVGQSLSKNITLYFRFFILQDVKAMPSPPSLQTHKWKTTSWGWSNNFAHFAHLWLSYKFTMNEQESSKDWD